MTKSDKKSSAHIERTYQNPDKAEHYAQWADTYEADLHQSGYEAPAHAVQLLAKIVPTDAQIIEFGCGTGLVGGLLAEQSYRRVVGIDLSSQMLEKAAARSCYQSLREHDLTQPLVDDIRYDAGICVGVCAFGPVLAQHIGHMTKVLVENAPLILTINGRAWLEQDWAEQLDDAQQKDGFIVEFVNTIPYLSNENIDGKLLIIRNSSLESETECTQDFS